MIHPPTTPTPRPSIETVRFYQQPLWLVCLLMFGMAWFSLAHARLNDDSMLTLMQLYKQHHYQAVLRFCEDHSPQHLEDSRLPYYQGLAYLHLGRKANALEAFQQVLWLDPHGPVATLARRGLYQAGGSSSTASTVAVATPSMLSPSTLEPQATAFTALDYLPESGNAHPSTSQEDPTPQESFREVTRSTVDPTHRTTDALPDPLPDARITPTSTSTPKAGLARSATPNTTANTKPPSTPEANNPNAMMQQLMMMQLMSSMGQGGSQNANSGGSNPMSMMMPLLLMQQMNGGAGANGGNSGLPANFDSKAFSEMMSQSMMMNLDLMNTGDKDK
ncbi:MAG: hypothetical protein ACKO34_09365 [Vampirovibrionales bacterium]